jgi:hypothetical protein
MLKRVMRSDVCLRVLCMFLHATVACGTELPDVLGIKIRVAACTRVYLLT